ncbi:hypothetical protein L1887_62762 [Cichorium endivia]|nr:hypothetical protein L1887_62762 [Cichorium endivia]
MAARCLALTGKSRSTPDTASWQRQGPRAFLHQTRTACSIRNLSVARQFKCSTSFIEPRCDQIQRPMKSDGSESPSVSSSVARYLGALRRFAQSDDHDAIAGHASVRP